MCQVVGCPEFIQPFGRQVNEQTSKLCFRKTVTVKTTGINGYDRRCPTSQDSIRPVLRLHFTVIHNVDSLDPHGRSAS